MHVTTASRPPRGCRHSVSVARFSAPPFPTLRIALLRLFILLFLVASPVGAQLVVDGSFEGFDPAVGEANGFYPDWSNLDPTELPGTVPGSWSSHLGSPDIFWSPVYVPHNFMTAAGGPGRSAFHGGKYGGISTGRFYNVWRGSETFDGTLRPAATGGRYRVRGRFAIGDYRNQPTFIKLTLLNSIGASPDFTVGFQLIATPDWNLFCRDVTVPAGATYDRIRIEGVDSLPKNWGAFCFIDSVDVDPLPPPCDAPSIDLGGDRTICPGTCVDLASAVSGGKPPYTYAWSPADGLSRTDCPAPRACPAVATEYRLTVTDAAGCASSQAVVVTPDGVPPARVSISRSLVSAPGNTLQVPVMLDDPADLSAGRELTITIGYDPLMLRLLPEENGRKWTDRGLLEGWSYRVATDEPGKLSIVLVPPPGRWSGPRKGRLLLLRFTSYLAMRGDSVAAISSELPLEVSSGSACLKLLPRPGLATLNVCGLRFRLMEMIAARYAIMSISPNPTGSKAEIAFSIGLEGATRVEVFDRVGRRVALLVDDYLMPGVYTAGFDASALPSGIYRCCVTSGEWSESRPLMIGK